MLLRDSVQDAFTVKHVLESLIRRSKNFEKDRESIIMELEMLVGDVDYSIEHMEQKMMENA